MLQSMGSQRVRQDGATEQQHHFFQTSWAFFSPNFIVPKFVVVVVVFKKKKKNFLLKYNTVTEDFFQNLPQQYIWSQILFQNWVTPPLEMESVSPHLNQMSPCDCSDEQNAGRVTPLIKDEVMKALWLPPDSMLTLGTQPPRCEEAQAMWGIPSACSC